jgi:hypothetical protein
MKKDPRAEYETRDRVLRCLSDDEVASVSTAETLARLPDGDEYIDLAQLDRGVLLAGPSNVPMGRILPKRAVLPATWRKILAEMNAPA